MCGGIGSCDPVGSGICPAIYRPVCGCDGMTHSNRCVAASAGTSIDTEGGCASTTSCSLLPRGTCCFEDSQCSSSTGRTSRCVGATCSAGSEGVCKDPTPTGRCWDAADCGTGEACVGASICPCEAMCLIADTMGTCAASVTP
ncbi:MAG: hypothetical protein DRJ42_25740 [Deltaproteobacteria bacterium]|nr:MAG: hypothetical protein DRJ42_25740 [Deltaproteobacteria bacterium]